jgi:hypothetical protein
MPFLKLERKESGTYLRILESYRNDGGKPTSREVDLPTSVSNRGYDSEVIIQSFLLSIRTGASRYIYLL